MVLLQRSIANARNAASYDIFVGNHSSDDIAAFESKIAKVYTSTPRFIEGDARHRRIINRSLKALIFAHRQRNWWSTPHFVFKDEEEHAAIMCVARSS